LINSNNFSYLNLLIRRLIERQSFTSWIINKNNFSYLNLLIRRLIERQVLQVG